MCISPVQIKNPYLGCKTKYKDTWSKYMQVPCGHCPQCIALDQMYIIQRLQMECMEGHPFFCTLTYNNERLPVMTTSTGYDLRYVAYSDLTNMFKRIRNNNLFGRPFKYIAVSERGTKRGRPHVHLIWILPKYQGDTRIDILNLERHLYKTILENWATNIGSDKKPVYVPNCTYVRKLVAGRMRYNYDLHYCDPKLTKDGVSEVGFYVLKYMLKRSSRDEKLQQALKINLEQSEYDETFKIVKSRACWSKGFGLGSWNKSVKISPKVLEYLHKCIDKTPSNSLYPCFFTPTTGQSFPMAPYFKQFGEILPFDKAERFLKNAFEAEKEELHHNAYQTVINDFHKIQRIVESHDNSHELDLLENL